MTAAEIAKHLDLPLSSAHRLTSNRGPRTAPARGGHKTVRCRQ
ncbi:helix-turn-helix domain-containing protein [Mesorhizobium sp.]|nr:helix-turn-helix domain-containing protein [Mesorhizobium sp.]